MAMLGMNAHSLAKKLGKSYEMARRYARGIAMPPNPEALKALAEALECSVGHLLADESTTRQAQHRELQTLTGAIQSPVRVTIEDGAMTTALGNYVLFAPGDDVTVYPRKAIPGDIVVVKGAGKVSLRQLTEGEDGAVYRPQSASYQSLTSCKVIGVVGVASVRLERA